MTGFVLGVSKEKSLPPIQVSTDSAFNALGFSELGDPARSIVNRNDAARNEDAGLGDLPSNKRLGGDFAAITRVVPGMMHALIAWLCSDSVDVMNGCSFSTA